MATHRERISRMKEVMKPIDRQIMMCDDKTELLMLASAMITASKHIFRTQLGEEGCRELLEMMVDDSTKRISKE